MIPVPHSATEPTRVLCCVGILCSFSTYIIYALTCSKEEKRIISQKFKSNRLVVSSH